MRILNEPVVQFLVLGGALFFAFKAFGPAPEPARDEIVITDTTVEGIVARFQSGWSRPPSAAEKAGLIEDYIAAEVLYREALKLGLDQDDPAVRRRMRQKMEFLLQESLNLVAPTDAELRAYYEENGDTYRVPARFTFRQVFLGAESDGQPEGAWRGLIERLNTNPPEDLSSIGAPSMLPAAFSKASTNVTDRTFGEGFGALLAGLALHVWAGPVRSAFGWHAVRVDAAEPGGIPSFDDVRDQVTRDFIYRREKKAKADLVGRLKQNYDILFETTAQ